MSADGKDRLSSTSFFYFHKLNRIKYSARVRVLVSPLAFRHSDRVLEGRIEADERISWPTDGNLCKVKNFFHYNNRNNVTQSV